MNVSQHAGIITVDVDLETQCRTLFIHNTPHYVRLPECQIEIQVIRNPETKKYVVTRFAFNKGDVLYASEGSYRGPLCLGRTIRGKTLTEAVKLAIERFWKSRFNHVPFRLSKLREDAKTLKTPKPKPLDWTALEEFDKEAIALSKKAREMSSKK